MRFLLIISDLAVPLIFAVVILFGIFRRVKVYDTFIESAKEGLATVVQILPTVLGLMIGVGILRASGFFDLLTGFIAPAANAVGFPKQALPLSFMRLVSSSAATGLLADIFKNYGPDSFIGRFVSVMMSCTETVFYTMSVYFMTVGVTKTRYTLAGALIANAAGIIASVFITEAVFGR